LVGKANKPTKLARQRIRAQTHETQPPSRELLAQAKNGDKTIAGINDFFLY
jgi:hypothetical protein